MSKALGVQAEQKSSCIGAFSVREDEDGWCVLAEGGLALTAQRTGSTTGRSVRMRCTYGPPLQQRTPYHVSVDGGAYNSATRLSAYPNSVVGEESAGNEPTIGVLTTLARPAGRTRVEFHRRWAEAHQAALTEAIAAVDVAEMGVSAVQRARELRAYFVGMSTHYANTRARTPTSFFPVKEQHFDVLQLAYTAKIAQLGFSANTLYTFFIHPAGRKHPLNVEDFVPRHVNPRYHLDHLCSLQIAVGKEFSVPGQTLYWRRFWLHAQTSGCPLDASPAPVLAREVHDEKDEKDEKDDQDGVTDSPVVGFPLFPPLRGTTSFAYYPHVFLADAVNFQCYGPLPGLVPAMERRYNVSSMTLYNTASRITRWADSRPYHDLPRAFKELYLHRPISPAAVQSLLVLLRQHRHALQMEELGGRFAALRMEAIVHISLAAGPTSAHSSSDVVAMTDEGASDTAVPSAEAPIDAELEEVLLLRCRNALQTYSRCSTDLLLNNREVAFYALDAELMWREHKAPAFRLYSSLVHHLLQDRLTNQDGPGWPSTRLTLFDYALYSLERLATLKEAEPGSILRRLDDQCNGERRLGIPVVCLKSIPHIAPVHLQELLNSLHPIHLWFPSDGEDRLSQRWVRHLTRRCIQLLCGLPEGRALRCQLHFSWAYDLFIYAHSMPDTELTKQALVMQALVAVYSCSFDSLLSDAAHRLSSQRRDRNDALLPLMQPPKGKWGFPTRRAALTMADVHFRDVIGVAFFKDVLRRPKHCFTSSNSKARAYACSRIRVQVDYLLANYPVPAGVVDAAYQQAVVSSIKRTGIKVFIDVRQPWEAAVRQWVRLTRQPLDAASDTDSAPPSPSTPRSASSVTSTVSPASAASETSHTSSAVSRARKRRRGG